MSIVIRKIQAEDNASICDLVVNTLAEFGFGGEGTVCEDPELKTLYEYYQQPDSGYYVLWDEEKNRVVGGGGYARLKGTTQEEAICELQKVYFEPALRGQGFGKKLMALLVEEATKAGYKEMYLETQPFFTSALALYEKFGFEYIPCARGKTGHWQCKVFMTKKLEKSVAPV